MAFILIPNNLIQKFFWNSLLNLSVLYTCSFQRNNKRKEKEVKVTKLGEWKQAARSSVLLVPVFLHKKEKKTSHFITNAVCNVFIL